MASQQKNGYHQRRQTFDASTEFDDYTNLLDDETKELLQKDELENDDTIRMIEDLNKIGIVDNSTHNSNELTSILIDPPNTHFKQWQQSRRRTLDELESKGVIDPNFFNLNSEGSKAQNDNLPLIETTIIPSVSNISIMEDSDDDYDIELYKNDLYYIHSHQIIPKAQKNMFDQLLKYNTSYNQNNPIYTNDNIITPNIIAPAPPPTAIHTPLHNNNVNNNLDFNNILPSKSSISNIDIIKNKLERHSKQLKKEEMINISKSTHYSSEKSIMSLIDNNGINNTNNNNTHNNNNRINYYNIASNIDSGILSSSIFLPYKQWIELSIIKHTEQANECLDQMKKESNMLEQIHRNTIHDNDNNKLYNGNNNNNNTNNNNNNNKDQHLHKLSEIDDNLADIRDKIRKMFRVEQHIIFMQQQYDTYINNLFEDKSDLLSIYYELKDRENECNLILKSLSDNEVWLITNIANIIAERSEKIDSFNRKIKDFNGNKSQEKNRYIEIVESTKQFIGELNILIKQLSKISDNKRREIQRLKVNINSMKKQNLSLIKSSKLSYNKIIDRLYELQRHYELPEIIKSKNDINTHINSRTNAITSSLNMCLKKINCKNYYNKALQLYQTNIIYSNIQTKIFYKQFVFLINSIIVDSMVIHEYINSNNNNNNNKTTKNNNNSEKQTSIKYSHSIEQSTDQILNDVFTPITLNPSVRSTSFEQPPPPIHDLNNENNPNKLLKHILNNNQYNIKFECIHLLNDIVCKYSLLKRIKIVSLFGHIISFRETVLLCLAQFITIQYKHQILKMNNDKLKIKKFATKYCLQLISNILLTYKKKNGLIKSIRKLTEKNQIKFGKNIHNNKKFKDINVYKIAALILQSVYNVTIPFPM